MKMLFRLLRALRPYRRQFLLLLLCVAAATAAGLVMPGLIRQAVDQGLAQDRADLLARIGITIAAVGLVRALLNFGRRYLSEWLINRTGYDFRNALYDKIQRLPFSFHDQAQTGQLMSRCTEDVTALSRFVGQGAVELLTVILLLAGIAALLVAENAPLTLIGLGPLLVLVGVTVHLGRIIGPLFLGIDQALGDVSAAVQENLTGVQVVRAFAREQYEQEKFAHANRRLWHARVSLVSTWARYMPSLTVLVMTATMLILWFGGRMVMAGTLTMGELVAFNAYLLLLAGPTQQLAFVVNSAGEAVAGGQRIFEILDLPEPIQSPPNPEPLPPLSGRVTFENVSFAYLAGVTRNALHAINFEALPNQVIALVGPTGSGKTTLANLIPRFYDPTEGRVLVDGHDVRRVELKALRAQIGLVLQSSLLFSASVRDNIAYGRLEASTDEIEAAARAARAHDFIRALPEGYATVIGERGVTLSGGQRQRVAIARALLLNPRILILDDATSSVDIQTEYLITQALNTLMQGRTTFVIAQRLSTVRRADQILVLDQGRIIQRGTHAELVQVPGLYQDIYNLQLKDQEQFQHEMLFLEREGPPEHAGPPHAERPASEPGQPVRPSALK